MGQAGLVVLGDGPALSPPSVAHQCRPGEPLGKTGIDGRLSPGGRMGDIGQVCGLPGPEPVFRPVHLCPGLVGPDHFRGCDPLPYRFVKGHRPFGESVQQAMYAALADTDVEYVAHHFPHPCEGQVLPCVEIPDKALDIGPVAYRRAHALGEVGHRPAAQPHCLP
jgi:hypothetical protein